MGYPGAESARESPLVCPWVIGYTGISWDMLGNPSIYWDIPGCPISWDIPVHTRISPDNPVHTSTYKYILGYPRTYKGVGWNIQEQQNPRESPQVSPWVIGYTGISWDILGYPGVY